MQRSSNKSQWNKESILYTQTQFSGSFESWCWVWEAEPWSRCRAEVSRVVEFRTTENQNGPWGAHLGVKSLALPQMEPQYGNEDLKHWKHWLNCVARLSSSCCACFCWTCYSCAIHKQKCKEVVSSMCSKSTYFPDHIQRLWHKPKYG